MKNTLRCFFVALALATTGLFAEAATDAVPAPATSKHKIVKVARKGKKGHKKHAGKHRKHRRHQAKAQ